MQIDSNSLFADYTQRLSQHGIRNSPAGKAEKTNGEFSDLLMSGVDSVNDAQLESQSQIEAMLTGGEVDTAEVMTSIQKADMAFRLLVQVRNKLMHAYEEIQAIHV